MIIDHDHPLYRSKWKHQAQANMYNGAFYYSKEIVQNIIPNVQTDRNWVTVRVDDLCADHSIVFIHNNLHPERYEFLKNYNDLLLVCGVPSTCDKVKHLGTPIYLPLSIDMEYVQQFKVPYDMKHGTCYVGRPVKRRYTNVVLPSSVDILEGIKRQNLLPLMASYEYVYAVGRTAIEAKALGCKLKVYDPRFPDTELWQPLDNRDAAVLLQKELNKIDGCL